MQSIKTKSEGRLKRNGKWWRGKKKQGLARVEEAAGVLWARGKVKVSGSKRRA